MHDIYTMLYGRIKLQNANPTYLNLELKRDGGKLHYMVVNSLFLAITVFTFIAFHFLSLFIPFVLVYLCEMLCESSVKSCLLCTWFVLRAGNCIAYPAPRWRTMRARGVSVVTQLDSAIRSRRSITSA